jgi:predicted Zn-dependent protease
MKPILKSFIALLILEMLVVACSTVPVTGRRQLSMIPDSEMLAMSFAQYDQFLKENNVSGNKAQADMVKRVGHRIEDAVTAYLTSLDYADMLDGYDWEFNLVEDPNVNAWCMPGGKVVVYTGIMPVTKNERGLAVVMGHEIAHAIAEHGNERMSQEMLRQMGGVALSVAVKDQPEETKALWYAAYGIGSEVGIMLPYSRLHESEADQMGLIFMAMAGYDPREAPKFWERMQKVGGAKPPEWLSTHPSGETRISNLNGWMDEAMGYYNASKKQAGN